ncbi:MAG: biopolymer transporter ExbD [Gammaproteobacteria bacterium]|nr:biopolymer transporter ExbD [Gammaproteobacteria bacterium]
MKFQTRRPEDVDASINVVPLIDVMFMLVLFFVVTTTFGKKSEINIDLPKASHEKTKPNIDGIEVSVDKQGNVYIGDQMLVNRQVMTIREALRDRMHDIPEPILIIHADAETTHQSVVTVMDAARQVGLVRMTFVTKVIEEEASP